MDYCIKFERTSISCLSEALLSLPYNLKSQAISSVQFSTMNPKIHFLGWDRPIVDLAVNFLTTDHVSGELNLSRTLIVVPTAHSGQRLREKLALYAAREGTIVFPGLIVTPDYLFSGNPDYQRVAKNVQSLALWTNILLSIDFTHFPTLFPSPPEMPDFDWAFAVACHLTRLRHTLADYGYQFVDVDRLVGLNFEEKERWHDLMNLENQYLRHLEQSGLVDRAKAIIDILNNPKLHPDIERIVVVGVPDPVPLSTTFLNTVSKSIPVDVCVYAPVPLVNHFDDWGRPLAKKWINFEIPIPDEKITLVGSPGQQTDKVLELLHDVATEVAINQISLGVPDEGIIPHLEQTIRDSEISTHFPGGIKANTHELFLLILSFQKFFRYGNYDTFSTFLRNPEVLDFVVRENPEVSAVRLLRIMDEFQNTYLPSDFKAMQRKLERLDNNYDDLSMACRKIQGLLDAFVSEPFINAVLTMLSRIYSQRKLNLNDDKDRLFCDFATLLVEYLSNIGGTHLESLKLSSWQKLEILLEAQKDQRFYPERPSDSIDLLGWLELLWEDAPRVILSGMNNGIVPEAIVGDPFLPEGLRKILNMKDNEQRFARDAYILAAIAHSRKQNGSIDIVIAKSNIRGEPVKPSRLLFLCNDSVLPPRALKLFGEVKDSRPMPPRTIDFRLVPSLPKKSVSTLSVTSFKEYLACPFRFFLTHILKMEAQDDRKTELDALDFGQICHASLEEFGQDESIRDSADSKEIGSFLASAAEKQIYARFGKTLPVSVMIQFEAIKERLKCAARSQAEIRIAGWKIVEVEKMLHIENAFGSGITLRGKVDRIDVHEGNHQFRVLDYKTSDVAVSPEKAHLKRMKEEILNSYDYFELGNKPYRWIDLQLPLYTILLGQELNVPLQCGYFNLPKAALEAGLQIWDGLDDFLLNRAKVCIRGIIDSIEKQIFWPVTSKVDYEKFESILLNNPTALVDPRLLKGEGG